MRVALILLLVLVPFARAEDAASFDQLVPNDTLFYAAFRNVPRTRERYKDGALRAFWEDPAITTFTENMRKSWGDVEAKMKEQAGVTAEEMLDVIAGEFAFYVPAGGFRGGAPEYVVLADIGANAERVLEIVANSERRSLEGDKVRRIEEEFRGVTIVTYKSTEEEGPGEEAPGEEEEEGDLRVAPADEEPPAPAKRAKNDGKPNCWCISGNLFAAAADVESIKMFLAYRDDEAAPRLADHEPYRRVVAKTGERRDVIAYLGYETMMKALKSEKVFDEDDMRIFGALGLAGIDAIGLQASLERDGFGTEIFVGVPGKKEGVLKMFDAPNEGLRPPAIVDPSVDNVGTWLMDIPGLWAEFRRIANDIEPGLLATVDGYLEIFEGASKVDIQTDFIAALGKEVTWYTRQREEGAAVPEAGRGAEAVPPVVIAIAVLDREKLDGALNGIQAAAQGMVQEEDYLGIKVRRVVLPFPISPCYALLPDQLVFALDTEDLKEVIRRVGKEVKSLRDTEDFQRCAARLPEGRVAVGFTREARAMRQSFLGGFLRGFGGAFRRGGAPFNMAAVPTEEVLARYLDVGSTSITNDEAGIHFRYFLAMRGPAEK